MGKKVAAILCVGLLATSIFLYQSEKEPTGFMGQQNSVYAAANTSQMDAYKNDLITELKREIQSLERDNKYLLEELSRVKKGTRYEDRLTSPIPTVLINKAEVNREAFITEISKKVKDLEKDRKYLLEELGRAKKEFGYKDSPLKFYGYTEEISQLVREHSMFREGKWKNGQQFKVYGNAFSNAVGFDRSENNNRNAIVAKLHNDGLKYSRLTGYIGVDDLAKDLADSEITFTVYNNDRVSK